MVRLVYSACIQSTGLVAALKMRKHTCPLTLALGCTTGPGVVYDVSGYDVKGESLTCWCTLASPLTAWLVQRAGLCAAALTVACRQSFTAMLWPLLEPKRTGCTETGCTETGYTEHGAYMYLS